MNKRTSTALVSQATALTALIATAPLVHAADAADAASTLWYAQPASAWVEALPVGNGRIGAMIFGGIADERIQFNDQSLWTGDSSSQTLPDASGTHNGAMGDYQPFGDLHLYPVNEYKDVEGYRRSLDLRSGVAVTRFRAGGVDYTREVFASHPAGLIVIRLTTSAPGSLGFRVRLNDKARPPLPAARAAASDNELSFTGSLTAPASVDTAKDRRWNGMRYHAAVRILAEGGATKVVNGEIHVTGADACTLLLAAATDYAPTPETNYKGEDPRDKVGRVLKGASQRSYASIRDEHISDHSSLYSRASLRLEDTVTSALPTDRRLKAYKEGANDPSLEALLFHYGRYLLIASSRPGGLPANLQGLWNQDVKPAWYSGYTTNINIEMNYWLAEPTNLAECHLPMLDWVDRVAAAQKLNPDPRLRTEHGWIIYSTNNTLGGNSGWALHRPGSAWLAQHFHEVWAFGGDRDFLKRRAYPHLRELTRMWDSKLVDDGEGNLITREGWSPEHGPVRGADGKIVLKEGDRSPQPGASYDQQIVWDLFTNFLEAAAELDADRELRAHIAERRARLLGPRVGRWGQLMEWKEDVDDPKNQHRHLSHLFALHPGRQIDPTISPELADAARVSLNARGDASVGWSRAWKVCQWARLRDGNRAGRLIRSVLEFVPANTRGSGTYANLFGAGPPFQIDANFGYTAGVAEMLLQSHLRSTDGTREIHLLPAIPETWRNGEALGLRARDGFTVDQRWEGGRLVSATLVSSLGKPARVVYQGKHYDIRLPAGGSRTLEFP